LIYIDEAGIDDNDCYWYGWSRKGSRCFAKKSGHRKERINFIAGLTNEKLVAPFIFQGYCDRIVFDTYVEHCLMLVLSEGDIVIADNAAFHKSKLAKDLIAAKGAKLIYLPPYSPDLNPIEHWWFPIKNEIRKSLDNGIALEQSTILAFNKYV
jgi:transposase